MKVRCLIVVAALVSATSSLAAQANTCPAGGFVAPGIPDRSKASQDACQMAVDVFQFVAPQLGVAITGGNATLGRGGALGGLGHFSVGVRVNIVAGDVPQVNKFPVPSTNGAVTRTGANALPSSSQVIGAPTVDAAIGLFKGFPLAVTNVGGIDALVSATYIPTVNNGDEFSLKPSTNLKFGYGVRVGLVQESIITPGVSFTYLNRDLPKMDMSGTSAGVTVNVTDAEVETYSWRFVASKSLMTFGIAIGAGQDKYEQDATVQGTVRSLAVGTQTSDPVKLSQDLTRTNVFADLSMNLPIFKLVGEIGQVSGGKLDKAPTNDFKGGSPTQSRIYGAIGIRLAF